MSDAVPLLQVPRLGYYQKLAEDFQAPGQPDERGAVRAWAQSLAEEQGIDVAPVLRKHAGRGALPEVQSFLARAHGFTSWAEFAAHLVALADPESPDSRFEAAVQAIVSGDAGQLLLLLRADPPLIRARSAREHRSTLLHYVSANGVEDFRQETPPNILEIARLLLRAGADVNAESDAYGGRSTTLLLTATSCHPENAGVQLRLLELLLAHGAGVDGPDGASSVSACLHNGRGAAAEFLARHGARMDLEGAAGAGRLDIVKGFFGEDGTLKPPASARQRTDGFAWACQFGRTAVVSFLLEKGLEPGKELWHRGQSGLHWAAYGGYPDLVKLLLQHGARADARDDIYHATPLGWACHAWQTSPVESRRADYREVVALLTKAGATPDPRILR